jgi:two-component system cell cycle sensor histidine kinase/response regulator CckA
VLGYENAIAGNAEDATGLRGPSGTTMTIYRPEAAPMPLVPEAPAITLSACDAATILVVDDEPAMLSVTARLLQRGGYHVLQAASGEEALIVAAENDFQLLLTDLVMPSMSGYLLTERLRAARPGLSVLFMSGYSRQVLDQWGLAEDEVMLIEKPFTEQDLLVKVSVLLTAQL